MHNYQNLPQKILNFANLSFNKKIFHNHYWKKTLAESNSYVNFSAYSGNKQYFFNKKRINNWKKNLKSWEIVLIQNLLKKQMLDLGYEFICFKNEKKLFKEGLKKIKSVKFLKSRLNNLIKNGVGSNQRSNNPKNYVNWSSRKNPTAKFINYIESKKFVKNLKKIKNLKKKIKIKKFPKKFYLC